MLQRVLATTSRRACASHLSHQVRRASMLGVYNTLKAEVPDHILLVQVNMCNIPIHQLQYLYSNIYNNKNKLLLLCRSNA
eukprot:m.205984 g.205984  ORF g.205984 m.205984 type:complete len:80 (-) comp15018_c0_seq30:3387-3626(-)